MTSRDPWLDNAKMVLVVLVVFGHAWSMLLPASDLNGWVYDFVYVWHMPAFVLVSGYLSRSSDWSPRRLRALVRTLVVPLVLFHAALVGFEVALGLGVPEHPFLEPLWPLWYLGALVLWRLVTPVFLRVPAGPALAAALVVSLLGGAVDTPYTTVSKAMGMLPFFVLGLVATPDHLRRLRSPALQQYGAVFLLLTLWVVRDIDSFAGTWWLYYRPYDLLGADLLHGAAVRLAVLALGLGCALGALSLVPGREGWFTRMGSATMVVFLFHGFVVRGLVAAGLPDWTATRPVLGGAVVVTGSLGLALALASPLAVRRLGPLVDPVGTWQRRRRATGRASRDAREHRPPAPRPARLR